MVVRNSWSMLACVCVVAALGCHKHSDPSASTIPVITSFSPAQGFANDTITVNGSGFDGTTNVSVGGAWATFSHINDGQITLVVPTSATTGTIGVINGLGSGGSATSFYVEPEILSITPVSGGPGTVVTIVGNGLSGTQSVVFGTGTNPTPAPATFYVNSPNLVQATVPLASASGPITLTVPGVPAASNPTVPTQVATTSPDFTFSLGTYTVPVFTSFTPAQANTGDTVTVTGTGMSSVSAVTIGGVSCFFTLVNDTTLTVQVPAAAVTGPINLVSVLSASPVASATPFTVNPVITNFSPAQGPAGTLVSLTGAGFMGTTAVSFGNGTLSNFIVIDANTARANVAAGSATGPITLVANGQTFSTPTNFTFTANATAAPVITSADTALGLVDSSVVLTGSGFTGVSSVTIGTEAAFSVDSDTQITVTVPSDAFSGLIVVTNDFGTATSPAPFYVIPAIAGLAPLTGPVGTTVTLTGSGFDGTTAVAFTGATATVNAPNFVYVNANTLAVQVPAGAITGPVTVTVPGVPPVSSNNSFTVQ